MPRQELIDPVDLVIGDAVEHIGQPGLRVDTVKLGGFDQGVGYGGGFAAAFGSDEQVVFAAQSHGFDGSFGGVVVRFEEAEMSPMARSFYAESKRVLNDRIKDELGVRLLYPDYRAGLRALLAAEDN